MTPIIGRRWRKQKALGSELQTAGGKKSEIKLGAELHGEWSAARRDLIEFAVDGARGGNVSRPGKSGQLVRHVAVDVRVREEIVGIEEVEEIGQKLDAVALVEPENLVDAKIGLEEAGLAGRIAGQEEGCAVFRYHRAVVTGKLVDHRVVVGVHDVISRIRVSRVRRTQAAQR